MNIILLVLIYFSTALIQNDYGEYTQFDSNACDAGSSKTKTISFSDTFLSVPQVFYNLKKLSLQFTADGDETQVKSEILSITTTDFQVKVSCPLTTGFSPSYQFCWYATMLQNITVIRSNIISNPKNSDKYTHTHSNSLATQGVVILTDLQYKTTFGFYLYKLTLYQYNFKKLNHLKYNREDLHKFVYYRQRSVSSDQVLIRFYTNGASPPVSIGYFIVIGPSDAFSLASFKQSNANQHSNNANVSTYETLFIMLQGFGWSSGQPQVYTEVTQNAGSSSATYSIGMYSPTVVTAIYYQLVWMCRYSITYPMYVHKYRITLIEVTTIDFPIKVILNGQTYTQVGKYQQTIPVATYESSVQIFMKFFQNMTLQGTLLKCVNCGDNFNYVVKKYYLNSINMIIFNLIIKQYQAYDIKNLEITIQSQGIMIKSLGTSVSDNQATVVNLQFQNLV